MPQTPTLTSTADVQTSRGARYGKQLASHLGRRLQTSWDDETGVGAVVFEQGRCDLQATPAELRLDVAPDASVDPSQSLDLVDHMEDVVGRHLVRFGSKDELTVTWVRSDGTAGRTQRGSDGPPEGHRPPS